MTTNPSMTAGQRPPPRRRRAASLPHLRALCALGVTLAGASVAQAHVSIQSGPAFADKTQVVTFGVGHGCGGDDTFRVVIDIPAGIGSVRPMNSDLGKATVQKNMAGDVVSVTWEKAVADDLDEDTHYYTLVVRMRPPAKPFSTLYFIAHQTCRAASGDLTTVDWNGLPGTPVPDGGEPPEPAAAMHVVPPRAPGWNRFTAPEAISDLATYFADALIVWHGTAAYSANGETAALIKSTAGVTELTQIPANTQVWVKY